MKILNIVICFSFALIIISCNTIKTKETIKNNKIEITKNDSLVIEKLGEMASKSVIFSQEHQNYLDYRALIKCIFSKQYKESILDFEALKAANEDSYVMDHTNDFYLGLCYLQLNEFEKVNVFLKNSSEQKLESFSEDYISSTDWFRLGISYFKLKNYNEAIKKFNIALKQYPTHSDAQYYKYQCALKLDKLDEVKPLIKEAFYNNILGNTI